MSVVLRKENGTNVDRANIHVCLESLPRIAEEVPLLKWLDPYGNTIFNAAQMEQIKQEIDDLVKPDGESEPILREVHRLCELGQQRPHLYLWFVGD
jgi:hypothetical protein